MAALLSLKPRNVICVRVFFHLSFTIYECLHRHDVFICLLSGCIWVWIYPSCSEPVRVVCVRVVKQFPGHKHALEVALLWFEVSLPVGPLSSHSRPGRHVYLPPFRLVCAGLALSPGVWLQSSFESILFQLTASITCLLSPHYAGLPLLIKQAHNTTFLAFFMCRLLSPFHMHGWVAQRNVDHLEICLQFGFINSVKVNVFEF